MKSKSEAEREAEEWMRRNSHKLRLEKRRQQPRLCRVGTLTDVARIADRNPRRGSDVYLDGIHYSIERVEVELSRVPGAPTMPVTQWRRYLTRLI